MRAEDRALARREPELPGLALLLDDGTFAAALREALPDAGVLGARGTYVRHKPGTNCVVLFEVRTASGVHLVHARAERPEEMDKLGKTSDAGTVAGPLGAGSVLLAEHAVAALAFPNDRDLPALPRLAGRRDGVSVLAYKPGRRLVARSGDAVLKAYVPERYAVARAAATALPRSRRLPVQRLRRCNDRRALMKFRWVEGRPLDSLLGSGDAVAAVAEVAAALAALNAAEPAGPLPRRSAAREAGALAAAAGAAGVAGPAVERAARRLAARLADRLSSAPGAVIHGDFSCDQVVMGARGATLLDLDEAALGDPAQDLGFALADLELRVLDGRLAADAAGELAEALRAACPHSGIRLWTAAGLLRRAAEPFRRRRPGWDALVEAAVERAGALAGPTARRRPAGVLSGLESVDLPDIGSSVLRRAWPRSGRLLLEYAGDGGRIAGAQWSPDPAFARAERERGGVPAPVLADSGILVHAGGADRRLPGLHELLSRPGAELLSHRPTRRAAVAVPGSFVKAVRPDRAAGVAEALRAAAALARGAFAVPAVQRVDPEAGTVACAPLPGRPLGELLAAPAGADAAAALGAAIRALHASPPPRGIEPHDGGREAALLLGCTSELEPWAPEIARAAARAARAVAWGLAALPTVEPAPLHRDLHDKQVLVDPHGGVGLLDFDTLATGDPALDVGNLLAHLELRALQGRCTPDDARRAAAAFLTGYEAGADLEERAAVYAAATRVRLACVYALRPAWRHLGEALLPAAIPGAERLVGMPGSG